MQIGPSSNCYNIMQQREAYGPGNAHENGTQLWWLCIINNIFLAYYVVLR